jgi:hypothetical protein
MEYAALRNHARAFRKFFEAYLPRRAITRAILSLSVQRRRKMLHVVTNDNFVFHSDQMERTYRTRNGLPRKRRPKEIVIEAVVLCDALRLRLNVCIMTPGAQDSRALSVGKPIGDCTNSSVGVIGACLSRARRRSRAGEVEDCEALRGRSASPVRRKPPKRPPRKPLPPTGRGANPKRAGRIQSGSK